MIAITTSNSINVNPQLPFESLRFSKRLFRMFIARSETGFWSSLYNVFHEHKVQHVPDSSRYPPAVLFLTSFNLENSGFEE